MATCVVNLIAAVPFPKRNLSSQPICSIQIAALAPPGIVVNLRRRFGLDLSLECGTRFKVMASSTNETEKLGIKVVNNPADSKLSDLGVRSWPKWGCPPSKFPWTYSSTETCYLLKGKVKVFPDGSDEAVEIGAGDLVVFPKGMSCTWDASEAVDKHYKFE